MESMRLSPAELIAGSAAFLGYLAVKPGDVEMALAAGLSAACVVREAEAREDERHRIGAE